MAFAPLSHRESEVLRLAAQGYTDKEIGTSLDLGPASVRTYWDRIRGKLKATNRAQAVALGMPHNRLERAAEELGAFVLRSIRDEAIFACTVSGHMLTWNQGVGTLFGYSEAEWVGKNA